MNKDVVKNFLQQKQIAGCKKFFLNFQEVNSAVSIGSYFKGYKKGIPYQYVVGKGTAVIDINVKDSSFSMDIDNEKQ